MTLWRGEEGNTHEVDLDYLKLQSRYVEISEVIRQVAITACSSHDKEMQHWFAYICNIGKMIEKELQARSTVKDSLTAHSHSPSCLCASQGE